MNEERNSQYMRWVKFDLSKKKRGLPSGLSLSKDGELIKRKTSCPLSSENCLSPYRKDGCKFIIIYFKYKLK